MVLRKAGFGMRVFCLIGVVALLLGVLLAGMGCEKGSAVRVLEKKQRLKVATTTSLYDTGLWGYLEPMFEKEYGVGVDVISVGSGQAFQLGQTGNVDVLTVHDPDKEKSFLDGGYGINRRCFAYNYFVIVGPQGDPAGIKGMTPEDAFKALITNGKSDPDNVKFVSRGDDSGTQSKEKTLWKSAGYKYEDVTKSGSWYILAGQGMGATLQMANEKKAYTLSDVGTYLAYKGQLDLVALVDQGASLVNRYCAIAVNPAKFPNTSIDMADNLINFLRSDKVQELIGEYGVKDYGQGLFTPDAGGECQDVGCPYWEECAKAAE